MQEIRKLSADVINQIAAGEVVERPASVLKELMENAIDAGATTIDVVIEQGGLERIEIRDNGKGIAQEDLTSAFERYATSKIEAIDDLQSLVTYGFRGEALAAIASVSAVSLTSKKNESSANTISVEGGKLSEISPASRATGTTITISNLFYNIPARQKFLKSADTEFKYILEIFQAFALLNGKIHFTLTNNEKLVYTLPATEQEVFPIERIAQIYKIPKEDLLPVSHEEYGTKVVGATLHPRALGVTARFLKLFVNNRPIEDRGIIRALHQGLAGVVPDNFKPSGVFGVFVPADQVDVNVHPRKMEVKFLNPFRIYSTVTHSLKMALEQTVASEVKSRLPDMQSTPMSTYMQPNRAENTWQKREDRAYDRLRGSQPMFFQDNSEQYVVHAQTEEKHSSEYSLPEFVLSQARSTISEAEVLPLLGRYITVAFMDEVWIVDQHAAAERIRYEQFKKAYLDGIPVPQQQLLGALKISLSEQEKIVVAKNLQTFARLGFEASIKDTDLLVTAIPVSLQSEDIEKIIKETVTELVEHDDIFLEPVIGDFLTDKDMSLVIATMACHNSVRMNQRISVLEAKSIITDLIKCKAPFACPHGRRIIWRLQKEEIDKQFMRI